MSTYTHEHEFDGVKYLVMWENGELDAIWPINEKGELPGKSIYPDAMPPGLLNTIRAVRGMGLRSDDRPTKDFAEIEALAERLAHVIAQAINAEGMSPRGALTACALAAMGLLEAIDPAERGGDLKMVRDMLTPSTRDWLTCEATPPVTSDTPPSAGG
jgi:hypothetical protein